MTDMLVIVRPSHWILSSKPNQQALASSKSEISCECMHGMLHMNVQLCLVVCFQCVMMSPKLLPKIACPRHSPQAASCLQALVCCMNVPQEMIDTPQCLQVNATQQMHMCIMISAACRPFSGLSAMLQAKSAAWCCQRRAHARCCNGAALPLLGFLLFLHLLCSGGSFQVCHCLHLLVHDGFVFFLLLPLLNARSMTCLQHTFT